MVNKVNYMKLGKTISYALRHHPEEFGLEIDEKGWVELDALLISLKNQWGILTVEDIYDVIARSDKKRYEVKDGKIRALYGHSIKEKIKKNPCRPPRYLYHGTARRFIVPIQKQGLFPMERQYVHLSEDKKTAVQVGKRHDCHPVVLKIDAQEAYKRGIIFYKEKEGIWLSESIPSQFIKNNDK